MTFRQSASCAAIALMGCVVAGCYSTTIRSGRLPDHRPAIYMDGIEAATFDARWHSGFINGIVEVGGNYNMERICPQGWAEITTQQDFLNSLLAIVTFGVYSPQSITIRCAAQGMPGYPPGPSPAYLLSPGAPTATEVPTSMPPPPPPAP